VGSQVWNNEDYLKCQEKQVFERICCYHCLNLFEESSKVEENNKKFCNKQCLADYSKES
jgi:hypothetical protein